MGVNKILTGLKEKMEARDELMNKLSRSLAIQEMWGSGIQWPCSSWVEGSPTDGFFFYLKDASGTKKKYTLEEIPAVMREAKHISIALHHASLLRKK